MSLKRLDIHQLCTPETKMPADAGIFQDEFNFLEVIPNTQLNTGIVFINVFIANIRI